MRTIEENKKLCEEMPYIAVHNSWTGKVVDSYDYTFIEADGVPEGWRKLFIQMCRDIKEPLIKAGLLDTFYFTQVKEKYNTLRAYNSGATREVMDIIDKYEYLSQFICQKCGRPATKETQGWIASYCNECCPEYCTDTELIKFNPVMHIQGWANGEEYDKYIDCSDEWRRLYE